MSCPGFSAEASLPEAAPLRHGYGGTIKYEPSNDSIEPALPGSAEQAYIDCVIDCRMEARLHNITDLSKCIRACAGSSGNSGSGTSGTGASGGSAPPPAICAAGSVAVTCPDGFIGCCPALFPKCTIL